MKPNEAMNLALIPSITNRLLSFIDSIKKYLNDNNNHHKNVDVRKEISYHF